MKPVSRRSLLASAAATLPVGALLAACGSDSTSEKSDTDSAGSDDSSATVGTDAVSTLTGTVNFLNFTGWAGPTTYADFAAKFPGATVNEIAWASADDTVTRAKDRAGDIDLVLVDGTTFPRLVAIDAFAQLGSVPNMKFVADQFKGNSWDSDNTLFAPTDHGRTGIIYRKDLVSTPPASWADFIKLAPEYAGKVTLLD
jgi:spermidine/putrescine transport system substrate-binding protein